MTPLLATGTRRRIRKSAIPGFGLTMGFTLVYLSLIVLIPLSAVFFKTADLGLDGFWEIITRTRVLNALKLSFGTALIAASINAIFGVLVAWVFVRYTFPGKRLLDAFIDLPFALPTAVAGIALTALYAGNGWVGQYLEPLGLKVAFTPVGIVVALTFVGLPFVVRTVQPVLEDAEAALEEAAASLGANRWQTIARVIFPAVVPSILTGFALAFARGVGEYGSVIFIAGNLPNVSEIAPLLIVIRLEEFDYAGATAIAAAMLIVSFTMLLVINGLQVWSRKRSEKL
ncbi:MAG: sulfate ABC transporter permease subunit CysT [Polycyclovorans sp.]|nr:sulfate ABC transporter permease subunit CysT [Polycyclovorans sp.]|tara:strand:+ start:17561 stop:18418 length:858 start_codon:yes stop_codon:yes gene_type:complete